MKLTHALHAALLALVAGCSGHSGTPAPDGRQAQATATRLASNPAPFLRATDCFSIWPSYDAWLHTVKARNHWWNPKLLLVPYMFPRKDFEHAQQHLECEAIAYASDGLEISGWMVLPRGEPGRRLPVLIFNRGGNGAFGAINFPMLMRSVFPYAERGFLVLASQYRGVPETDPKRYGDDQFGGNDVRDVTRLIALAKQLPYADPGNIFMLGVSRGGMMSFMAARRNPGIKALAVISGASDLEGDLRFRPEMEQVYVARIPHYRTEKSRVLAERSVMAWAADLPADMPVLLLHGDKDERVSVANARRLHVELDRLHRPNKLVIYPGDDHFLSDHRKQAVDEVVHWFQAAMAPADVH